MRTVKLNIADMTVARHIATLAIGKGTPEEKLAQIENHAKQMLSMQGEIIDDSSTFASYMVGFIKVESKVFKKLPEQIIPNMECIARTHFHTVTGNDLVIQDCSYPD